MTYTITNKTRVRKNYERMARGNKLKSMLAGLAGLVALTCTSAVGGLIYNDARTERLNLETKVTAPENPRKSNDEYEMPELDPQVVPLDEAELESPAPQPQPKPIPKVKTKTNYKVNDFSKDSDKVLLARMLFGEARNCSDNEKVAIAYTVLNRVYDGKKWNGETVKDVILSKKQYSCFNEDDPNKEKLMNPQKYDAKSWEQCLRVAEGVLNGEYSDPKDATHYHTLNCSPKWANSYKMKKLGRLDKSSHIFYREG